MVSVGKYSWGPSIKDFRTDGVGGGGGGVGEEIQLKRTYTDKGGQGLTKWECPLFVIKY